MKKKKGDGTTNWSHKHDFPIDEVWNTKNTLALSARRLPLDFARDVASFRLSAGGEREVSGFAESIGRKGEKL